MSVTLREKKNLDKDKKVISISLYLDIYDASATPKRRFEFIHHLKLDIRNSAEARVKNKATRLLAETIRSDRAHELASSDYDVQTESGKKTKAVEWMQKFIDGYKLKDKRNLQGALNRFKDFIGKDKDLTFKNINVQMIEGYREYLKSTSKGEGASSYYARFKKMMKEAYKAKLINRNPVLEVKKGKLPGAKKKDTLTIEEIKQLVATPTQSEFDVRNAFLFCLVTGLRWIDVHKLTWSDINGKVMTVIQSKTEREITVNLNDTALKLIGRPKKSSDKVFRLPTADGANKTIKAWVKRAGITKKVTWHNARHSFGTNLIVEGTDVLTVSSMLGHAGLMHTMRYVKAAAELKNRASDKLNFDLEAAVPEKDPNTATVIDINDKPRKKTK